MRHNISPDYEINTYQNGSEVTYYKGIGKLIEETGEVLQLLGKAMAFPVGEHPDGKGPIRLRLPDELTDLTASILYFLDNNNLQLDFDRLNRKVENFTAFNLPGVLTTRRLGKTSDAIKAAPQGAIYVYPNSYFPKELARKLGRKDIEFKTPNFFLNPDMRRYNKDMVVVDHACPEVFTREQWRNYYEFFLGGKNT